MRLFIASTFPEEVIRELNARVCAIKPKLPHASWVKPETQHLTFAFLGEQNQAIVDKIAPELEAAAKEVPAFEAILSGAGFFPNNRHARVGWIGLDPDAPFARVAAVVRKVVLNTGISLDRADFRPHLTLMRLKDQWPPASVETFHKSLGDYRSAPFTVRTITLYSSRLNPTGAIHTPLREFALG